MLDASKYVQEMNNNRWIPILLPANNSDYLLVSGFLIEIACMNLLPPLLNEWEKCLLIVISVYHLTAAKYDILD